MPTGEGGFSTRSRSSPVPVLSKHHPEELNESWMLRMRNSELESQIKRAVKMPKGWLNGSLCTGRRPSSSWTLWSNSTARLQARHSKELQAISMFVNRGGATARLHLVYERGDGSQQRLQTANATIEEPRSNGASFHARRCCTGASRSETNLGADSDVTEAQLRAASKKHAAEIKSLTAKHEQDLDNELKDVSQKAQLEMDRN